MNIGQFYLGCNNHVGLHFQDFQNCIYINFFTLQERRMKQQREILRKEKETAEKIAARAFAQSYLADLVPSVFGTLSDNGYFFDPVERGQISIFSNEKFSCLFHL